MLAFFQNDFGFGGNNGLTDFKDILGFNLQNDSTRCGLFIASALALLGGFALCKYIAQSRLGSLVMAIRDSESRVRFMGYRDEHVKLFIFVISALLAGIAGALYVPQVGIINPSEFAPIRSIELVIWVAIGGRGTLYGAVLGAFVVNYAKTFFTAWAPEAWLFILGGIFVFVTVFMPKGLVGVYNQILTRKTKKKSVKQKNTDIQPSS